MYSFLLCLSAVLSSSLALAWWIVVIAVLASRRMRGGGGRDGDGGLREGFAAELRQDRPFRVFHAKPKRGVRVIVPFTEKPHPAALKGLERYRDAGVSVERDISPVADVLARQTALDALLSGKKKDDLVVTDTGSLNRAHNPAKYRILSYLRDSEKFFCVFGGVRKKETDASDERDEDEGEKETFEDTTLRKLLSEKGRKKSHRRPRFLCVSELDVWMLKTVAAMAAGVVDLDAVADVERVPLKELGERSIKRGNVVACLLTKRHRKAVWDRWKERDAVWYDYWEDMDGARLRVSLPFYKPVAMDVRHALLPSLKGQRNIYTTVAVDAVLVGRTSLDRSHPLLPLVAEVVVRDDVDRELDIVASNNYLMQHFSFYAATHTVCAAKNAEIYRKRSSVMSGAIAQIGRPKFHILEQFTEKPERDEDDRGTNDHAFQSTAEISMVGRKVRAYWETLHDTGRKVARVTLNTREEPALRVCHDRFMTLRRIPVRYGDRVILDGEKGGTYFVETIDAPRGILTLSDKWRFAFDPSRGDQGMLEDDGDTLRVVLTVAGEGRGVLRPRGRHAAAVRSEDAVYVFGFGNGREKKGLIGVVKEVRRDSTTVMLEVADSSSEEEKEDDEGGGDERMGGGGHFICVEDPRMKSRPQCEAAGNTWDRPCRKDEECPYFQANKRYRNYRGGCVDGYCEMPVGVDVRGFRVPVPSPAPACHGCEEEPWDLSCCANQEPEPDFAFVGDFNRRQRSVAEDLHRRRGISD